MKINAGITLIELLLVIAIVALLGAAATPFLSSFVLRTNFDATGQKVVSSIRKAQGYAMDGKQSQVWGVCKSGNYIRLFSGSCGSPVVAENFLIPSSINISGLSEITFNLRGEPSAVLSISVTSSLESETIGVNAAGGMTIN